MLIVLPFCQLDCKLALGLAKYLQYLGPYKQHELMLVCPPEDSSYLEELQSLIGDQFARVSVFTPQGLSVSWPKWPNTMFFTIANHVAANINCPCWYMFEPDNTPIKPGWANTLANEYTRSGRPFMGVVHPTYWRRKNGTWYQDGIHLNGSAIYPKNTPNYSKLFRTIPHANVPWDVYWQWDVAKYATSTNLIHFEWRSFNYQRDKRTGEIIGERLEHTLPPEINAPIPLRPDAVVHHGCKDGSLLNIMRGLFTARKEPLEPVSSLP